MNTDELLHETETIIPKVEKSTSASESTAAPETTGVMDLIMRQLKEESPSTPEHLVIPELKEQSPGITRHLNMRQVKEETPDNADHLMMNESQEESPDNADSLIIAHVKEDILDEHVPSPDLDEDMADEQSPDGNTQDEQTPEQQTPEIDLTVKDGDAEDDEDEEGGSEEDDEDGEDDDEQDNAADDGDYSDGDGEDADEAAEDEEEEEEADDEEAKPAAPKKRTSVQVVITPKDAGNYYLSKSQIASANIHSSLPSHNESAKMHSKSSTYAIEHRLSSTEPFSIIAYTLTSGPYEGRVAWVADPDTRAKFKFLELPPEVRNMIYDLLFVRKDSKVTFSPTKRSDQGNGSVSDLVGTWMWTKNGLNRNRQDWYVKGLGLLATCKEIREEAAGVVYGSNAFEFVKTTAMRSFLTTIGGRNRSLIRKVNTGWIIQKDARAAANLLLDCKQLETLHLDLTYMTSPPYNSLKTPEKVVPLFRLVLKQMFAYLYGKHVQTATKTKEKTFSFFTKGRVTWEVLGPPYRDTIEDKATRRECNRQMKARILEATNSKKVITAHQSLVKKEMAAAARKEAATEKKRVAAQKKLAPKRKTVVKKPATPVAAPAQPAVGDRVTRSQTKTILRREVD